MSHLSRSGLPPNVSIQDTYLPDNELESDLPSDSEEELALWRHDGVPWDIGTPTRPWQVEVDSESEYLDDDSLTSSDAGDPNFGEDQTSTEDPKQKEAEEEFNRVVATLYPAEKYKAHCEQMRREYHRRMQPLHERLDDEQEMAIARAQEGEEESGMEESEL